MNLYKIVFGVTAILSIFVSPGLKAQMKITDGASVSMNPNSLLELESPDKGLLIPRVSINSIVLPAPLTAPVPEGMLVYSSGGAVNDGFYYWDGTTWIPFIDNGSTGISTYYKNADANLARKNSIVVTENSITLTLPQITSADTGLHITVKNNGSHTDLVTVKGYGSAVIDDYPEIGILPRNGVTLVAFGTNWIISDRKSGTDEILEVGPDEIFQDIYSALEFLEIHMDRPMVIRLAGETEIIDKTITIDLPFALTIQGISYGSTSVVPAAGLSGKPMFRCLTECYFKMLVFDASAVPGYGTNPGEDAIRIAGQAQYHEIKDCTFDRFYNSVVDSADSELWMFECDILNSNNTGLLVHSPYPAAKIRVSETDFIGCNTGISLSKGSGTDIQVMSGVFTNDPGNVAISYDPLNFSFASLIISNNSWNRQGTGITGFDFARPDGRDANVYIENNPGIEGNLPHCKINVTDNSSTVTCSVAKSWYKANWTNTSEITTNIRVSGNRITYLPNTSRDIVLHISGNILVNNNNRVITIGIAKNGNTSNIYGSTTLRTITANQPFQFSTVIYLEDIQQNDYFELFCSSANSWDVLTFQDINWFTMAED